ncbi:unnamed protein product [Dibothriocephalus latus]|uniref:Uncharacterized protein n=1 Tax=Dibothriocephalus latus TaxID=60516 RepID=A0A3P7P6Z6_DIBLA|nr:unnamed protein product [Dibothriocephalus latus]
MQRLASNECRQSSLMDVQHSDGLLSEIRTFLHTSRLIERQFNPLLIATAWPVTCDSIILIPDSGVTRQLHLPIGFLAAHW